MARIPIPILRGYLLGERLNSLHCLHVSAGVIPKVARAPFFNDRRDLHSTAIRSEETFRARLKQERKAAKARGTLKDPEDQALEALDHGKQKPDDWELTVGIEIHAVINTPRKLFSAASATINDTPNANVALFDLAVPGSQPHFQREALIPALRAALALNCDIQRTSTFDRKHYFHWDQPSGYQITQYYQPFARNGFVDLYAHDGIADEDGEQVRIGIKQVQLEQDTAKTVLQGGQYLLDYNRAGLALIEIITMPQFHHPRTAAAFVRKVQNLLKSVDACVMGMEQGGLRADVNVSVRKGVDDAGHAYAGVRGLGQRTEIKNLSSFKAVEDAIKAEQNRQIAVLEAGGVVLGETRGWTLGSTETTRLRGKEGEVDYRYMPDPDIPPLRIGDDLIRHLRDTMGVSRENELSLLVDEFGLTMKDAMSLVSLDDGYRAIYFHEVLRSVRALVKDESEIEASQEQKVLEPRNLGRVCGNWVLHELGGLGGVSTGDINLFPGDENSCLVPAESLASIIHLLLTKQITGKIAKKVLTLALDDGQAGRKTAISDLLTQHNLWLSPMSLEEYRELARKVMDPKMVDMVIKGQTGKMGYFMGQMLRQGDAQRLEPEVAQKVLWELIEEEKARRQAEADASS